MIASLWGLAAAVGGMALPSPVGPPSWFTNDDFPNNSQQRITGPSIVMLDIDPQGKVVGCSVLQSSSVPELDKMSCRVVSSRKFKAAQNQSGEAVWGLYQAKFNWKSGKTSPALPMKPDMIVNVKALPAWYKEPFAVAVQVGNGGRATACIPTTKDVPEASVVSICKAMAASLTLPSKLIGGMPTEYIRPVIVELAVSE